jgi:hypothetical protein
MHTSRSRLGSSQHGAKEGRRTLGEKAKRAQGDEVRKRGGEMAVAERNGLGLDMSPLFIAATVKGDT